MSDQRQPMAEASEGAGIRLAIQLPPDARFRVVAETALRIYLRPICRSAAQAPQLLGELSAMIDEVAGDEPIEVVFTCRRPALEVTVCSGKRRRSRRWLLAPEERPAGSP